jgi:hypothetical protein
MEMDAAMALYMLGGGVLGAVGAFLLMYFHTHSRRREDE